MPAYAKVNGTIIAQADSWETVEGNIYFPPESLKKEFFQGPTSLHTHCPWKGDASYYNIEVGGSMLKDAAWYYPEPYEKAKNIKDYVAFYKTKVDISKD